MWFSPVEISEKLSPLIFRMRKRKYNIQEKDFFL